ncbi:MAG: hypothetical protein PUG60_13240 [Lachnospiraceae bacterium]|nr:hypothetical protein [Lachnospiraceae bacterium]MDY4970107.1 hypothetical protein [Lachnospiraceae bacterium]
MKKYTACFLLLFFTGLFAVGGFLLPGFFLDRQQDALFSKTETLTLPVVSELPDSKGFRKFSAEKLLQVASSYSFEIYDLDYWLTYTPEKGQLTTEELLQVTHQQIDQLCELHILPDLFSSENYTYEGVEHGIPWSPDEKKTTDSSLLNSDYSGWIVSGGNSNLSITAYVNSATGQILYLNAFWNTEDRSSLMQPADVLYQYLKYLELDQEPVSIQEEAERTICAFDNYDYILNVLMYPGTDVIAERETEEEKETEKEKPEEDSPIHCSLSISILNAESKTEVENNFLSP